MKTMIVNRTKIAVDLYKLTDATGFDRFATVRDCGDCITIGGLDANGQYQQFDSEPAFNVYQWAERHGMTADSAKVMLDMDELFAKNG